jgi:lipoprotein-releasing system permease protein
MRFELFIAARYLRAKRRQAVIGIITAISVIGVAAGVASLIIALAVNNGFRQDLQERLLGSSAHVSLMRVQSDGITSWQARLQSLEKQPHVLAASPAIYEQVLISRGARAKGSILKGVLPDRERRVSELLESVKLGSVKPLIDSQNQSGDFAPIEQPSDSPSAKASNDPSSLEGQQVRFKSLPPIILGKDMADELGATVGSVVLVTSPQGELTPFGIVPKYVRFKVVGIFQSGFYDYDTAWALTDLRDAQQLFGLGDVVSVLEFKIDDIYKAGDIGKQIEQAAGSGFMTTNWMEQNRALFRALRLERVVTFITIGLIVFVAALNILISLIMMVMEKTKDIAVLVSMGAKRAQVRRIFILQGVLIGVIGTAIGLVLGFGLSLAAGHYKWVALSAEVYSIDYVPFAPRIMDGVLVALVALAISLIATIYPSHSASKILPAEALRYE